MKVTQRADDLQKSKESLRDVHAKLDQENRKLAMFTAKTQELQDESEELSQKKHSLEKLCISLQSKADCYQETIKKHTEMLKETQEKHNSAECELENLHKKIHKSKMVLTDKEACMQELIDLQTNLAERVE